MSANDDGGAGGRTRTRRHLLPVGALPHAQHLAVADDLHEIDARALARQARVLAQEGVLAVDGEEVLGLDEPFWGFGWVAGGEGLAGF